MLYLFTSNTEYTLREQVKSWKNAFISKHGDFNLLHLKDLSEVDNNFLTANLTGASFFNFKKLVIIDNLPLDAGEKSIDLKSKQDFIESLLDKIPEENIILFNSLNPDKRTKFYKELSKKAEIKDFSIKNDFELENIIDKKYKSKISNQAIKLIIKYKSGNLIKIFSELEKLFIIYDYIDINEIIENIVPELDESIFQFIDDLLNLKLTGAFEKLNIILEQTNIYAFYNNLLANLRVQVFIERLKNFSQNGVKIITGEIGTILGLGNRGFLVDKKYKITYKQLESLYIGLVDLDKKMKSGKMIGSEDNVFKIKIEECILRSIGET